MDRKSGPLGLRLTSERWVGGGGVHGTAVNRRVNRCNAEKKREKQVMSTVRGGKHFHIKTKKNATGGGGEKN